MHESLLDTGGSFVNTFLTGPGRSSRLLTHRQYQVSDHSITVRPPHRAEPSPSQSSLGRYVSSCPQQPLQAPDNALAIIWELLSQHQNVHFPTLKALTFLRGVRTQPSRKRANSSRPGDAKAETLPWPNPTRLTLMLG